MATLNNNNPQDDEQKQAGAPTQVGGTAGASGGGGASGSGAASPVQQNAAPQSGAGYTDVASYLNANQQGSKQLGNQVAGKLTDTYNATKSGIDQSVQGAQTNINKGYIPENKDLIQQVASNPVAAAANPDNAKAVQGQLNDSYSGPLSWEDFGTQQGKVAQAQQQANLTKTPGGLNVLASQVEAPTASQGVNQLDALFLGGEDASKSLKSAADPFGTLNDYINAQNTAVGSSINNATQAAQTAQADARGALLGPNGATGQLDAQVQNQLSQAIQNGQTSNKEIADAVKNRNFDALVAKGVMTQQQASDLHAALNSAESSQYMTGHNFGAASQTTNVDLNSWLNQQDPNAAYTAQNVATPEEYARAQALQSLVGTDNYTTQLTDPSQAGTAPKNLSVLDYLDATNQANAFGTQARQSAQDEANRLTAAANAQHDAGKGGFLKKLTSVAPYILNPSLALGKDTLSSQLKK